MIQIREIDHLVLRVLDLDTMLRFYCGVLGCAVERRQDELGLVQLRAGRSMLDLVPVSGRLGAAGGAAPGPEGRNLDHFCFRIEPFVEDEIRSALGAHGIRAGATESRHGAEGAGPSLYIQDPEGNTIELKGPPAHGAREGPRPAMDAEAIVQAQLAAYNARDLERFLACYSEQIQVFRPPAGVPALEGKAALAAFYAAHRFNRPELHARIANRMVLGDKVIDHEVITGLGEPAVEVAVVYEVGAGLIQRVWSFPA